MSLPMIKNRYNAKAIAFGLGETNDGKPQIGVMFEIVDHPDFPGEQITWFGYFTEKTEDRTIESLQHMGWQGDDLTELAELAGDDATRVLPTPVSIVCEPDTYDAKTKLKAQGVNQLGGG